MTTSAFDPASRVRFIQYIPYLERAGWRVVHRPNRPDRQWSSSLPGRIPRAIHHRAGRVAMKLNRLQDVEQSDRFDVVFVNRDLAGRGDFFERRLLAKNDKVVFDFDDAIFTDGKAVSIPLMCERAARVTVGNEYLAQYARNYSDRVTVIPTVVDTDQYRPRPENGDGPRTGVRVGWTGSDQSIDATLFPYLPMLADLQRSLDFELVIVTNSPPRMAEPALRWKYHPWSPEEDGNLGARMDIGLMPLLDDPFQRGKCALKLLQYMAAGLPTVASPVGVNREVTRHGVTGFLANSTAEWRDSIASLIHDRALAVRMGRQGRKRCEEHYSLQRWLPELLEILHQVKDGCVSRESINCRQAG